MENNLYAVPDPHNPSDGKREIDGSQEGGKKEPRYE